MYFCDTVEARLSETMAGSSAICSKGGTGRCSDTGKFGQRQACVNMDVMDAGSSFDSVIIANLFENYE